MGPVDFPGGWFTSSRFSCSPDSVLKSGSTKAKEACGWPMGLRRKCPNLAPGCAGGASKPGVARLLAAALRPCCIDRGTPRKGLGHETRPLRPALTNDLPHSMCTQSLDPKHASFPCALGGFPGPEVGVKPSCSLLGSNAGPSITKTSPEDPDPHPPSVPS